MLITGEASSGKPSPALELISRGHRPVAGDATGIHPDRAGRDRRQSVPNCCRTLLEVRELGAFNVREMFDFMSVKPSKYLRTRDLPINTAARW